MFHVTTTTTTTPAIVIPIFRTGHTELNRMINKICYANDILNKEFDSKEYVYPFTTPQPFWHLEFFDNNTIHDLQNLTDEDNVKIGMPELAEGTLPTNIEVHVNDKPFVQILLILNTEIVLNFNNINTVPTVKNKLWEFLNSVIGDTKSITHHIAYWKDTVDLLHHTHNAFIATSEKQEELTNKFTDQLNVIFSPTINKDTPVKLFPKIVCDESSKSTTLKMVFSFDKETEDTDNKKSDMFEMLHMVFLVNTKDDTTQTDIAISFGGPVAATLPVHRLLLHVFGSTFNLHVK